MSRTFLGPCSRKALDLYGRVVKTGVPNRRIIVWRSYNKNKLKLTVLHSELQGDFF